MKFWGFGLVCLMLVIVHQLPGQNTSDPLNRLVTFKADSISKACLLDSLEKGYKIYFSYNPLLIGASEKISVDVVSVPLSQLLHKLVGEKKAGYTSIGSQVIFFPSESGDDDSLPKTAEKIVLKGVLLDERNSEPLPYCNIIVMGHSVGTISNQNGRFSLIIDPVFTNDTIQISSIGYHPHWIPVSKIGNTDETVRMKRNVVQLKSIDVVHYQPHQVLDSFYYNIYRNYESEFALLTTYYREIIKQNNEYTDVSEAVLEVMKAPYNNAYRDDHVKFVKGRKSSETKPFSNIKLKLKGGPYYITQLDVVKNLGSFIDPEYRYLYTYTFNQSTLINNRETLVLGFQPLSTLRDVLYKGRLFIDRKSWALCRIEFEMTKEGLSEARSMLIEKEPRKMKAIPQELSYVVDYQLIDNKWYFLMAKSTFNIKINDRQNRQKTRFNSVSEILTTQIEKGDFLHFSKRDIFKPNEFITEKIDTIDYDFWRGYNIIEPEDELVDAIRDFESYNLVIKHISPSDSPK